MEKMKDEAKSNAVQTVLDPRLYRNAKVVIPVIVRADSLGTLSAVIRELEKRETEDVKIKIIGQGIGPITEGDVMQAGADEKVLIIGFAVKIDQKALDQSERFNVKPQTFDIIYKLSEWFDTVVLDRLPYEEKEVVLGTLKVLKTFSSQKDKHVIGGKVETGRIVLNSLVKVVRRGVEMGRGRIVELQSQKIKTQEVLEGNECGLMVETKVEMIPSDILESIQVEKKRI
jgi:translation initiation factor IF-2